MMEKSENPLPPKLAEKFLMWFLRDELAEEVLGDLDEKFSTDIEEKSAFKAQINYWYQVINYLRPFAIRHLNKKYANPTIMFKHNILISFRNFRRYKSSFFINLVGLSTGLACALLIYLWVSDELMMDKFHEKDSQLFQIMEHVDQANGTITRQTTAGPTAEALKQEMPEIEYAVTATTDFIGNYTLSVDNNDLKSKGLYASEDFFKLFSYKVTQGNKNQVLSDKMAIVLSEDLSKKLFGTTENVVGKMVEFQHDKVYQVSGIFEDLSAHSSLKFDFILTWEEFKENNEWVTSWENTAPQTYLLMKRGSDIDQFNSKIVDFVKFKTNGDVTHRKPFATLYSDSYLYNQYENGLQAGGRIEYIGLFSIIALFILFIACINFMNLSTARASRRIKEVGIKKAVGARRISLIYQHLGESILMALLSLMVALIIVALFLPQFNTITEKQLKLMFSTNLILTLSGIVLITGLIAGSYPALYLSSFNPVSVLKGKLTNLTGEIWVRKGLVVFQFTLSVILMVSVWVVYQQIEYVQNKNLGYDKDNILIFSREGQLWEEEKLATFIEEVRNMPGIVEVSSSEHDMTGHNGGTYGIQWPGKDPEDKTEFERAAVNYGMIEMLGIEMKEGRPFMKEFGSDTTKIIFNESAIKFMGITDPIGKVIKLWGEDREIIGVAKDFHFDSFHEEVKPLFFRLAPESTGNIMVKIKAGKEKEAIDNIKHAYQSFNTGFPFDYHFLDEDYDALYSAEQRVSKLSKYFAGITILISCLGLFGLAAFTAERRFKEIGVRKILGSTDFNIVYLLSVDFTKMVIIAILIALPFSYFVAQWWLESFAFSINLEWWYFAGAALMALLIAWFTVGLQTIKASRVNPAKCLKSE